MGDINPNIKGSFTFANLQNILPEFVSEAILEAMPDFAAKIKDYDRPDTVMSAIESRSSSPVQIVRNESYMSTDCHGIFPAGEGAGYAGGITSAAADGIKVHESVTEYLIDTLIESYKINEINKYKKTSDR